MSGGSFNYAYSRVQDFADELEHKLAAAQELRNEGKDGSAVFDAPTTERLERIGKIVRDAAALMKEVEWLYSGDNGEDSFARNVQALKVASLEDLSPPTTGPEPENMVTIKRSVVDCSNHLAVLSEHLLDTLDQVHVAEEAEDDAGMEEALAARSEYSRAIRSAVYKYRKRLPKELMDSATVEALSR